MKANRVKLLQFQGQFHFRKRSLTTALFFLSLTILISSCSDKEEESPTQTSGKLSIQFSHLINGQPVQFDTLIYTNEADNPYMINEIQYFISDVVLYKSDGSEKTIDDWEDHHYVDTDITSTFRWEVYDDIGSGIYDSISFIFGFKDEKNMSFMFVNPPERDMFWPEYLGGGYHYLKLNGKWLEPDQTIQTTPFDFHLGRGQIYYSYPDSITGFVSNEFRVSLQGSGFIVQPGITTEVTLVMNIEKWFKEPNIYDHNVYGGYIMQNQDAMEKVKENGHNVFTFLSKEINQ